MTSLFALWMTLAPVAPAATVTGLSVVPVADRTEVVIRVDADTDARDFIMDDGRLVIDLDGVRARAARWNVDRGGVGVVRLAQYQPDVVRVVIELDRPLAYRVLRDNDAVRVSFPNPAGTFQPWSSNGTFAGGTPPATSPAMAAPAAQPQQQWAQQRPPLTVTFNNAPVPEVLATFAAYADRSIIPAPGIRTRTVTAEIIDQPWEVALEAILQANNMILRELPSGVMVVDDASAEAAQSEPLESRQFQIQYVSADSLQAAVQGLVSERGKVAVNRSSNALLVTDTRTSLARLEPLVRELDQRTPQVQISARIAFIDRTALEQVGIVYDLKDYPGGDDGPGTQLNGIATNLDAEGNTVEEDLILLGGNSIAAIANANNRVPGATLQLAVSLLLGRHTLVSFLEALQTVSLTDIQAAPVVTTLNHRAARIQVGEETPIRVIDAGAQQGGGAIATVQFRQTGIILDVTPHVTGNQVVLDIQAERSNLAAAPSDIGFTFQTQNAQTQVLVDDGETAVIGGLTETVRTTNRTGIPILMDLPVIGGLFRNTSESEAKRDLLIMVTPHIIRN